MFFITGDIHGNINRLIKYNCYLSVNDTLIVLGDFGCIWDNNTTKALNKLATFDKKINYNIAFVDGNHENFKQINKIEKIEKWYNGKVGRISKKIIHLLRGEIYTINNKRIGVIGGADSIDKQYRIPNLSWWSEEQITQQDINNFRANLNNNFYIDIMLTHDCPASIVPNISIFSNSNTINYFSKSQKLLEEVYYLIDFKHWYFGHWHCDKDLLNKFECLYFNLKELPI